MLSKCPIQFNPFFLIWEPHKGLFIPIHGL